MAAATVAAALATGAVSVPLAQADDLKDKQQRVEKKIENADHALEESSRRLNAALGRLEAARAQFEVARAEVTRTRERLGAARERDQEMQEQLLLAQQRLEQAETDLVVGRADLDTQREAVTDMVTSIYQDGDPQLQAFSSMLQAQDPADLTWSQEGQSVMVGQETRAYDELRAAEVLLEVRQEQMAAAEKEVEARREAAAAHLLVMKDLTEQARAARIRVREVVGERRSAKESAAVAKQRDRAELAELRQEEQRIRELIARQSARSDTPTYQRDGAFLSHPVPGGYVTSPFGMRTHPIYGYYSLHSGTDFGGGCGMSLAAAAGGRVISKYYSPTYGNRLLVHIGTVNGQSMTLAYNHASSYTVGVGQTVQRGQVVGYSGNTGWSTACHLHFMVLVNGQPVDPMNWM